MRKPKSPEPKPAKGKQPAASQSPAEGELNAETLDGVTAGTGSATAVNTYRVDPYKSFKFH